MLHACALIAHLIATPLPHAGEAALKDGWINPVVWRSAKRPDAARILADNGARVARIFAHHRLARPEVRCDKHFARVSLKLGPWPGRIDGIEDSPDDRPLITFTSVTPARHDRWVLVAWNYYYGPLNAGSHYAIMRRKHGRWHLVRDARYGPIA